MWVEFPASHLQVRSPCLVAAYTRSRGVRKNIPAGGYVVHHERRGGDEVENLPGGQGGRLLERGDEVEDLPAGGGRAG